MPPQPPPRPEEAILNRALQMAMASGKAESRKQAAETIAANTSELFSKENLDTANQKVATVLRNVENKYIQTTLAASRLAGLSILHAILNGLPQTAQAQENVEFILSLALDSSRDIERDIRTAASELCLEVVVKFGRYVLARCFSQIFTALSVAQQVEKDRATLIVSDEICSSIKETLSNPSVCHVPDEALVSLINQIVVPLANRGSGGSALQWTMEWIAFWLDLPDNSIISLLPQFAASLVLVYSAVNSDYVKRVVEVCRRDYQRFVREHPQQHCRHVMELCEVLSQSADQKISAEGQRFCLDWIAELLTHFNESASCDGEGELSSPMVKTILSEIENQDPTVRAACAAANTALQNLVRKESFTPSKSIFEVTLLCLTEATSANAKLAALQLLQILTRRKRTTTIESFDITGAVQSDIFYGEERVRLKALEIVAQTTEEAHLPSLCEYLLRSVFESPDNFFLYLPEAVLILQPSFEETSTDSIGFFLVLSEELIKFTDLRFVSKCVLLLNSLLLTADELAALREKIRNVENAGTDLDIFKKLYKCWQCNAVSVISLSLLSKQYPLALKLARFIAEREASPSTLLLLDRLVTLLETPVFSYLRMDLALSDSSECLMQILQLFAMILPLQCHGQSVLRERLALCGQRHQSPAGTEHEARKDSDTEIDTLFNEFVNYQRALGEYEASLNVK